MKRMWNIVPLCHTSTQISPHPRPTGYKSGIRFSLLRILPWIYFFSVVPWVYHLRVSYLLTTAQNSKLGSSNPEKKKTYNSNVYCILWSYGIGTESFGAQRRLRRLWTILPPLQWAHTVMARPVGDVGRNPGALDKALNLLGSLK